MSRTGRTTAVLLLLGFILVPVTALAHGAKEPPTVWLEGELVDLACFLAHGARGADNALCATQRTVPDQPIALLTEDGAIVLLWADHHSTHPYDLCRQRLGETVRIGGARYEHGSVSGIEVREVKRLKTSERNTSPSR